MQSETLLLVEKKVKPGVTTAELDRIAEEFITPVSRIPLPASTPASMTEYFTPITRESLLPTKPPIQKNDIVSV